MPDNTKSLTRDDIDRLMRKVDAELARRGQRAVLYIVGGANIAMAVDGSRTTTDIDVVVKRGFEVIFGAAQTVARTEPGLGNDWINAAFTQGQPDGGITWQWMDNKDDDTPVTALKGSALHVELASPQMMLALKRLSQRPQDMPDIYKLMRMTGITSPDAVGKNLARFTGRRIFDAQNQPGMFLHVDPQFRNVFDNAPDDLRPSGPEAGPEAGPTLRQRFRARQEDRRASKTQRKQARKRTRSGDQPSDAAAPRCGMVKITYRGNVEVTRTQPCRRPVGHGGRHKFGGQR